MQRKQITIINGENSDAWKVFSIYDEARPPEFDKSILVNRNEKSEPTLTQDAKRDATNILLGAGLNAIDGTRGALVGAAGVAVYQAARHGFNYISEKVNGKNNVILENLAYPDESYHFPTTQYITASLSTEEIVNLKSAYLNLCKYIEQKKNRNILHAFGLQKFNDQEINDAKYMAAVLLAHKIESIFESRTEEDAKINFTYFKTVLSEFSKTDLITKTKSEDEIFLSLQTVLENINHDFSDQFKVLDLNTTDKINALGQVRDEFCKKSNAGLEKFNHGIYLLNVQTKQNDSESSYYSELFSKSLDLNLQIDTLKNIDLVNIELEALQNQIKVIKLNFLAFLNIKNKFFNHLQLNFKNYNAATRTEVLKALCQHTELLKQEWLDLLDLEARAIEIEMLFSKSPKEINNNLAESKNDLGKSWVYCKNSNDLCEALEKETDLVASFIMMEVDDQNELPVEANKLVDEYKEKVQTTPAVTTATTTTTTTTPDLVLQPTQQPTSYLERFKQWLRSNGNNTHIPTPPPTSLPNLTPVITPSAPVSNTAETNKIQELEKQVKDLNKQVIDLNKQVTNLNKQIKLNDLDEFNTWILNYITKTESCGFFSRHGAEGRTRANNLLKECHKNFRVNNKEFNKNNFIAFIQANLNKLQGNYLKDSLNTYILTFYQKTFNSSADELSKAPLLDEVENDDDKFKIKKDDNHETIVKKQGNLKIDFLKIFSKQPAETLSKPKHNNNRHDIRFVRL